MAVTPAGDPPTGRRADRRHMLSGVVAALSGGAALVCLLGAPVAVVVVSGPMSGEDLARISNVGQAYGALLSAMAMIGIAVALALQVRAVKITQAQGVRLLQFELMKMLIADLELRPLPSRPGDPSPEQRRRDIFSNLMIKYLEMGYEIGYFPASSLQAELRAQFAVPDIAHYWERARGVYASGLQNSAQLRFMKLVDQAYGEAMGNGRPHGATLPPP